MMTKREALELFGGSQVKLAEALEISKQAVSKWKLDEPIPELREMQLRHEILPKRRRAHQAGRPTG